MCKYCKVIPGESVTTQHKLLIIYMCIKSWQKRGDRAQEPMIKWWKLIDIEMVTFKDKLVEESDWESAININAIWVNTTQCMETVAKETLGVWRREPSGKKCWMWLEALEVEIKAKQESYRKLKKCRDDQTYERYK